MRRGNKSESQEQHAAIPAFAGRAFPAAVLAAKEEVPSLLGSGPVEVPSQTPGFSFYVDAIDLDLIAGMSWSVSKNKNMFYVRSGRHYLHRLIAGAKPREIVDHINGNGLDNRRANLRIVSHQVNKANAFSRGSKTSEFIGVSRRVKGSSVRFYATAKIDGKNKHLGSFLNEEEAALAYDESVFARDGQRAMLNFPRPGFVGWTRYGYWRADGSLVGSRDQ